MNQQLALVRLDARQRLRRGRAVLFQVNSLAGGQRCRVGIIGGELEPALDAVRPDDLAQGYETLRLWVGWRRGLFLFDDL
jgi:hypothetical protein